jgi:hypothetical protein
MAIGKNLKPNYVPRFKLPRFLRDNNKKRIIIYVLVFIFLSFGLYGILNLIRLAPKEEERQDLVYETGDQPLPEEIKIWIDAAGGLNMRSEPSKTSTIIKIIPDGTELIAIELSGEWYRVSYDGKTGWVHKDFVRTYQEDENDDTENDWKSYKSKTYGFSVSYPKDWVYLSYGANAAANLLDYVAFGLQLSDDLDPAILPPIVIKITSDTESVVNKLYSEKDDASKTEVKISGQAGTKYTYTASSGVQMTAFVVASKNYTYILEESGGYADELSMMIKGFTL